MKLPKARSESTEYNMRFKEERAAHNRRKVEEEMEKEIEKPMGSVLWWWAAIQG